VGSLGSIKLTLLLSLLLSLSVEAFILVIGVADNVSEAGGERTDERKGFCGEGLMIAYDVCGYRYQFGAKNGSLLPSPQLRFDSAR
jgi:hypothetical protein